MNIENQLIMGPQEGVENWAICSCSRAAAGSEFEPGDMAAIYYKDNCMAEGTRYYAFVEYDGQKWRFIETGDEICEFVGDEVLRFWPLTEGRDIPFPNQ